MGFRFMRPKARSDVKKSEESQKVLDALEDYLNSSVDEPMRFLARFWRSQIAVITYEELRSIVEDEDVPENIMDGWFNDYSTMISDRMTAEWEHAMIAGASSQDLNLNTAETNVRRWITERSADLVTSCCNEQRAAIRYVVAESLSGGTSSAEVAQYVRATVGLTRQQAAANLRHYNAIKEQLRADHPRMSASTIERRARRSAARYAEVQHRYRAETIARTELATAYHQGNDEAVRQAMAQNLMPKMKKIWSTARDDKVCRFCAALEGIEADMDGSFQADGRSIFIPPAHPRCGCAVKYVEVKEDET